METHAEHPYLSIVGDSEEERRLREKIQSLMWEKQVSVRYNYMRNSKFHDDQVFPEEILDFPMSFANLEYLAGKLELAREYVEGSYPRKIMVDEKLTHPPTLKLIR